MLAYQSETPEYGTLFISTCFFDALSQETLSRAYAEQMVDACESGSFYCDGSDIIGKLHRGPLVYVIGLTKPDFLDTFMVVGSYGEETDKFFRSLLMASGMIEIATETPLKSAVKYFLSKRPEARPKNLRRRQLFF